MVSAAAVLAMVDMYDPDSNACPTNSGNVYVSSGTIERVSTIRLLTPGVPPTVTKLTLTVILVVLVLVMVHLSIKALQLVAVYCVVCEFSNCLGGTNTLTVMVMMINLRCCLIL